MAEASRDLQLRLLAHAIGWVNPQDYRPRLDALKSGLGAIQDQRNHTLGGCILAIDKAGYLEICREPSAILPMGDPQGLFDRRWRIVCDSDISGLTIRALGEDGLAQSPDWRDSGNSRRALLSSPSFWRKDELIAAPFAGKSGSCTVDLALPLHEFFRSIMTH